jgi:hypothetical protein
MTVPEPGAVEPELLAQLDRPQRVLVSRPRVRTVEEADGEEAEPRQRPS